MAKAFPCPSSSGGLTRLVFDHSRATFAGASEIEVKMAERAWEAAVLPLNYARKLLILC
jgi:hypothetical protein